MKVTVATVPLSEGLNLSVINNNVSKFEQKSAIAEVSVQGNELVVNLESESIISELRVRGSVENFIEGSTIVDCLKLKSLVGTFDNSVTQIEFIESGLVLYNGKSKFVLEKVIDTSDLSLRKPVHPEDNNGMILNKDDWKFVKDHQMYAISIAYIHPVYTYVYVGDNKDVIVGDFDNSIFTHSSKNQLSRTCLLSDTIINLFNSLPEGSRIVDLGDSYAVSVNTDSFSLVTQFIPKFESDENVGSYHSEIILNFFNIDRNQSNQLDRKALNKFLNQCELLNNDSQHVVTLTVDGHLFTLKDDKLDCKLDVTGSGDNHYGITFKASMLKSLVANMDGDLININPLYSEEDEDNAAIGLIVWTDNMEAMLAGVE